METLSIEEAIPTDTKMDPRLQEAWKKAEETKNLMPIIKEELRLSILNKRHSSGKGDIEIQEKKPVAQRTLTAEELRKKERRKEQNRRAAQKCRKKKKQQEKVVREEYMREQAKQRQLETEVYDLKRERAELQRLLDEHAFVCQRPVTPVLEAPIQTPYAPLTMVSDDCFLSDTGCDQFSFCQPFLKTAGPTCTVTSPDQLTSPDAVTSPVFFQDLPEEFVKFQSQYLEPCSPDMIPGRRSISEYQDVENILGIQP